MDDILRPHTQYAKSYADDVAVHSGKYVEHLQHLAAVLQAFQDVGMTVKLSKAQFCQSKVKFIGFSIGLGSCDPLENKILAIRWVAEPHKKLLQFFWECAIFSVRTCLILQRKPFL